MTNLLTKETSPYLLQHAMNPVHWYPWGEDALAAARESERPILLSIGYSSCHWCHVMAHESFEDADTAEYMNEHFINIKVDREERPDIDDIYMKAVQGLTGQGGWPLTVFLTPSGKPFFGGTYFPPMARMNMPSFRQVMEAVIDAWRQRRQQVEEQSEKLREFIAEHTAFDLSPTTLTLTTLREAGESIQSNYDPIHGGFGAAPKFPQAMSLDFLLRRYHRTQDLSLLNAITKTLDSMAHGGIYDQLGGGFHRYSVDAQWLVPHFEKMLYDNALLSRAYLDAFMRTRNPLYERIACETLDYVRREMTDEAGGFYSAQDADSEGEEGKYYVWTPAEIEAVVGADDARLFSSYYGVTPDGNFEGKNILFLSEGVEAGLSEEEIKQVRTVLNPQLLEARAERVKPETDTKVISGWNGLMLQSFAQAARQLGRPTDLETAIANGEFLLGTMVQGDRLAHTYTPGKAAGLGFLEDYGSVAVGFLALYEATFDTKWFSAARRLCDTVLREFHDGNGVFYDTSKQHQELIVRPRNLFDNAVPSGTSLACDALLRVYAYTGDSTYSDPVEAALRLQASALTKAPSAFGRMLSVADNLLAPIKEVAIVGDPAAQDTQSLLESINGQYAPDIVLAVRHPEDVAAANDVPLLVERHLVGGEATAYVCRQFVCKRPTTDPAELRSQVATS
ncbi:MAG: thioredoxin domain-containing protein [Chloroflexota bacterium]|nr:thioredoxin domain-containing protein [Chloroflexota bacterium]MDE2840345.1 thioredoxin domain-containing protein [Chloroflexota bacterium]